MDRGRVAEQGTHEELIEKGGIYAKIYDLQMQQSNVGEEDDI
jgi:ABC-type multidrug transport system fused ATPase/permease subunit